MRINDQTQPEQDIPDELKNATAALPQNMTVDDIEQELLQDDMTVQVEQFVTTFIENVTQVAFKAIANKELNAKTAYHDFRQLLIYVRGLRLSLYDREVNENLLRYFAVQIPKGVQKQDQHILTNYINFFKDFFTDYFQSAHYHDQAIILSHMKEARRQLEKDYGYEPNLTV